MKKIIAKFLVLIIICGVLPINSFAETTSKYSPPFDPDAKAVYLRNLDTDELIYEKNSTEKIYPASTTKIMTAILALELVDNPETVEISLKPYVENEIYLENLKFGGGLSTAGLLRNETVTLDKLLYALLLPSANEVAMMIADYVGDSSIDYFLELMNEKAREIGAVNTHFTNTNGLHNPDHYTTAYDLYLISKYAMENPKFVEIVNTLTYHSGATNKHEDLLWINTNKTINPNSKYYSPAISGIKTGTTDEAGRCLISTASKDGYNYLLVVMGGSLKRDDGEISSFYETNRIYNWVFETFKVKTIIEKGEIVSETPLRLAKDSQKDHLKLMCGNRLTALMPDEIDVTSVSVEFNIPSAVNAPVKKGDKIGTASYILAGDNLGTVDLVSAENIEASTIKTYIDKAISITRNFWFKFAIVFLICIIICYSVLAILQNKHRRRR